MKSQTPFDTFATIPPESLFEHKCQLNEKTNAPPISIKQVVGSGGKGRPFPRTGIKIAHTLKTAYDVGRTVATAAAPLIAMAL